MKKIALFILLIVVSGIICCEIESLIIFKYDFSKYEKYAVIDHYLTAIREALTRDKIKKVGKSIYYYYDETKLIAYTSGAKYKDNSIAETYKIYPVEKINEWEAQLWIYKTGEKKLTLMYYENDYYYVVDAYDKKVIECKYDKKTMGLISESVLNPNS